MIQTTFVTGPVRMRINRLFLLLFWLLLLLLNQTSAFAADEDSGQTLPDEATDSTTPDQAGQAPISAAITRVLPDTERNRHRGVSQYLTLNNRQYEQISLVADETEFYGLFMMESAGMPQGGVLILHDDGQHSHWPATIAPLRETLPQHGWATLSIELPETPAAVLPPRPDYQHSAEEETTDETNTEVTTETSAADETATTTEETDSNGISLAGDTKPEDNSGADDSGNEPPLPPLTTLPPLPEPAVTAGEENSVPVKSAAEQYQQQMLTRIRQGVSYLNQRGQMNVVVIATGNSASWAVAFMLDRPATITSTSTASTDNADQNNPDHGYTLVLVDAVDNQYSPIPLDQQLGDLDIPVLDLVSPQGISPQWTVKQRAGVMRHKQRLQYQQIAIPSFALQYDDTNLLTRRVQGWLKTHAAGTELPTAD